MMGIYSLFMTIGMVVGFVLALIVAKRLKLPLRKYALCLTGTALAVPVGSRLLFALTNKSLYLDDPLLIFNLDSKGFSLFGGLLAAAIVSVLLCRLARVDLWRFADSIAPGVGIGLILTRIGCYKNGCCFGTETDLPWGVVFPVGTAGGDYQLAHRLQDDGIGALFAELHPVHPTQLYEIAGLLIALIVTAAVFRRTNRSGLPFIAFILIYTVFRWGNHYLRVPSGAMSAPDWFTPLMYSLIIAICCAALFVRVRNPIKSRMIPGDRLAIDR